MFYTIPNHYPLRNQVLARYLRAHPHPAVLPAADPVDHRQRIMNELKAAGVSKYALWTQESRYLPKIIHDDEHIGGVVYGHHEDGFAMLIATERRVIFLDTKPLFKNEDEIDYNVVIGVNFSHAGFGSTVILHTHIKDYPIRTMNRRCAERFVRFIESRRIEHVHTPAQVWL